MHQLPIFLKDLALILIVAGSLSVLFYHLRIPVVLGYLAAGFLLGPHFHLFPTLSDTQSINLWSELGLIFLMFGLGLHFQVQKLLTTQKAAKTAVLQFTLSFATVYFLGRIFGWTSTVALFTAGACAVSSTSMILKAFEEGATSSNQSSQLTVQVLVYEDLLALLTIVLLSGIAISNAIDGLKVIETGFRFLVFLVGFLIIGLFIVPQVLSLFHRHISSESLLLFALGLCFLYVTLASSLGFSPALGAFLMGAILAETRYKDLLDHLLQPLKYLFLAVFFISLGMMFNPQVLVQKGWQIGALVVGVFFAKLLGNFLGHLMTAQKPLVAWNASVPMVMLGELSLLISGMAVQTGVATEEMTSMIAGMILALSAVGSIAVRQSDALFHRLQKFAWVRKMTLSLPQDQSELPLEASVFLFIPISLSVIWTVAMGHFFDFVKTMPGASLFGFACWVLHLLPALFFASALVSMLTQNTDRKWIDRLSIWLVSLFVFLIQMAIFPTSFSFLGALITAFFLHSEWSKKVYLIFTRLEAKFIAQLQNRVNPSKLRFEKTPWEAHQFEFTVPPHSRLAGKPLKDLAHLHIPILVTSLARAEKFITAPSGNEVLCPLDVLSVIGTDSALKQFALALDQPHAISEKDPSILFRWTLKSQDRLVGKSLADSKLREAAHSLVVGIERGSEKHPNPSATWVFAAGDVLWLVGDPQGFEKHLI